MVERRRSIDRSRRRRAMANRNGFGDGCVNRPGAKSAPAVAVAHIASRRARLRGWRPLAEQPGVLACQHQHRRALQVPLLVSPADDVAPKPVDIRSQQSVDRRSAEVVRRQPLHEQRRALVVRADIAVRHRGHVGDQLAQPRDRLAIRRPWLRLETGGQRNGEGAGAKALEAMLATTEEETRGASVRHAPGLVVIIETAGQPAQIVAPPMPAPMIDVTPERDALEPPQR
jgi:hypothetical protein